MELATAKHLVLQTLEGGRAAEVAQKRAAKRPRTPGRDDAAADLPSAAAVEQQRAASAGNEEDRQRREDQRASHRANRLAEADQSGRLVVVHRDQEASVRDALCVSWQKWAANESVRAGCVKRPTTRLYWPGKRQANLFCRKQSGSTRLPGLRLAGKLQSG